MHRLQNHTAAAALAILKRQEGGARGGLENVVDALAAEAGALEVALGTDLPGDDLAVVGGDEAERLFAHLLDGDGVIAEVLFEADEDYGDAGAEVHDFCDPLGNVSGLGFRRDRFRGFAGFKYCRFRGSVE